MPGATCDHTCAYPHMSKTPSTSIESPVQTSLLTVQWHITNMNFVVPTVALVTLTRACAGP